MLPETRWLQVQSDMSAAIAVRMEAGWKIPGPRPFLPPGGGEAVEVDSNDYDI